MKKDTKIIVAVCAVFLAVAVGLFAKSYFGSAGLSSDELTQVAGVDGEGLAETVDADVDADEVIDAGEEVSGSQGESDVESDNPNAECAVYVCGAVNEPGIYRYQGSARVCDAIEAVGGFTEKADPSSVNLARLLTDGEQIFVLTRAQVKKQEESTSGTAAGGEENANADSDTSGLVDLNTADKTQLMTLPGIGEAKAELIITYREENGKFEKTEDIMNISGIKDGTYNQIKDYITVS